MPPYSFALPNTVTFALVKSIQFPPFIWTEPLPSYDRLLTFMVRTFADAPPGTVSATLMTLPLPAVITSRGMTTAPDAEVPAFVGEDCPEVDDPAGLLAPVAPDAAPAAAL